MKTIFTFFIMIILMTGAGFGGFLKKGFNKKPTHDEFEISGFENAPVPFIPNTKNAPGNIFAADNPEDKQAARSSIISVNFDDINDLNWKSMLDVSGFNNHPSTIVVPFFESYPIEKIEVKVRILDKKF